MIKFGCSPYKILKYVYNHTGNPLTKRNPHIKTCAIDVNKIIKKYNFPSYDSLTAYLNDDINKGLINISNNEIYLTSDGQNYVHKSYSEHNAKDFKFWFPVIISFIALLKSFWPDIIWLWYAIKK